MIGKLFALLLASALCLSMADAYGGYDTGNYYKTTTGAADYNNQQYATAYKKEKLREEQERSAGMKAARSRTSGLLRASSVICGVQLRCPDSDPVCCTDTLNPFCAAAGQKCCISSSTYNTLACDAHKECCIPAFGAEDPEPKCCEKGETCDADGSGLCVNDTCSTAKDINACTGLPECGWCCNSFTCQDKKYLSGNCAGGDAKEGKCVDSCTLRSNSCADCESAVDDNGVSCGWCCETQTCMSKASQTQTCSYYDLIPRPDMCGGCQPGGKGVYVDEHAKTWNTVVFIVFPCLFGVFMIVSCIRRCTLFMMEHRAAQAAEESRSDAPAEGENANDGRGGGAAGRGRGGRGGRGRANTQQRDVLKYGFGEEDGSVPASETDEDVIERRPLMLQRDAAQHTCVRCEDSPATTIFLPCYHSELCHTCCKELLYGVPRKPSVWRRMMFWKKQGRDVATEPKASSGTSTSGSHSRERKPVKIILCPSCNEKVETVVDMTRVVFGAADVASVPIPDTPASALDGNESDGDTRVTEANNELPRNLSATSRSMSSLSGAT